MPNIGNNSEISKVRFVEQIADPAAPAVGYWVIYIKTDGVYIEDSAGNVTGPLGNFTIMDETLALPVEPNINFTGAGVVASDNALNNRTDVTIDGVPVAHATSHENGGGDEIDVGGLSGVLADAQTPTDHDHQGIAGDGGKLSGAIIDIYMDFEESSFAPAAPGVNVARLYAKDDGGVTKLYYQRSDTTEVEIGGRVERIWTRSIAGTLTVSSGTLRLYNILGASVTINEVHLSVGTAPTGASIIVDVHKDGVTIFTNPANRPQIADSAYTGNTTTIDVPTWADNEYLTVDIDQIGAGVAGADLTVIIKTL